MTQLQSHTARSDCAQQVRTVIVLLIGLTVPFEVRADEVADMPPQWIWAESGTENVVLRRRFELTSKVDQAQLWCVAEYCRAAILVNGKKVAELTPYGDPFQLDVTDFLGAGENSVTFSCVGVDGPSAIAVRLELSKFDGTGELIVSNEAWQAAERKSGQAHALNHAELSWRIATAFGKLAQYPWGQSLATASIAARDEYAQWKQALGATAGTDPATFQVAEGFEVSLIRSAVDGEDSWVSLVCDQQGRWIVAKETQGLLRITLDANSDQLVKTETVDDTLAECRGLLFAYGSLYAMANNDKALYRLRDTTGDDVFDEVSRLAELPGDVGHGRNQISLGPDGRIYVICGDAVFEPATARSVPPPLSDPDEIERARSGFVARTDPDGRSWEIVSRGLRNPFGIDFNEHGEIFTYDADAEYDMGSSWYRPTRVNHVVVGGDYGWRRVTRRWPPYFPDRPDMPQPTLDIGKGSPTAVAFGYRSNFPWPWRDSLFVLDWSYGRILSVQLEPRGSSYAGSVETFLRGTPLNVTDIEFGPKGAMYFITGGRGTRSALYRVRSIVNTSRRESSPTRQQFARRRHAEQSRALRRDLERYYGGNDPAAVDFAWPQLSSSDPWVRNAARTVVEWQPVNRWQRRAIAETDVDAALAALIALSRSASLAERPRIVARLNDFNFDGLTERQRQEIVFLYERCLTESTALSPEQRRLAAQKLDTLYPDDSFSVNRRLSLLLVELEVPEFVERTIGLLLQAETQQERFHYLFALRNARAGWTTESRETYYDYFRQTAEFVAGEGMPRFLQLIRSESLATVPAADREDIQNRLTVNLADRWENEFGSESRDFVKSWRVADFEDSLGQLPTGGESPARDLSNGRRMFGAARCIACHRMGNRGGVIGPDLTSVARRFGPRDLLTSILEPSKVVADQYRSDMLVLADGRVLSGRLLSGDFRSGTLFVMTDPLAPEKLTEIAKNQIELHKRSETSLMPSHLLDTLSKEDVLDLLWWIIASSRQQ